MGGRRGAGGGRRGGGQRRAGRRAPGGEGARPPPLHVAAPCPAHVLGRAPARAPPAVGLRPAGLRAAQARGAARPREREVTGPPPPAEMERPRRPRRLPGAHCRGRPVTQLVLRVQGDLAVGAGRLRSVACASTQHGGLPCEVSRVLVPSPPEPPERRLPLGRSGLGHCCRRLCPGVGETVDLPRLPPLLPEGSC